MIQRQSFLFGFYFLAGILYGPRSFAQPPDLEKIQNGEIYRSSIEGLKRTFFSVHRDSALIYANELFRLAQENENNAVKSFALQMTGEAYRGMSDIPSSLNKQFEALRINKIEKDRIGEAYTRSFIGLTLNQLSEYRQAIDNMVPFIHDLKQSGDFVQVGFMYSNLCEAFTEINQLDSALLFYKQSEIFYGKANDSIYWNNIRKKALQTLILRRYASLLTALGNTDSAIATYFRAIDLSNNYGINLNKTTSLANLSNIYAGLKNTDSSIKYARLFLAEGGEKAMVSDKIVVLKILMQFHQDGFRPDSALVYANRLIQAQEQIYGEEKLRHMQFVMLNEQQSRIDDELRRVRERDRQRGLTLGVILLMIIGFVIYLIRNIREKKRTNQQIEDKRLSLEQTLNELRSTQSQLIQSEKMASLGELTAGIAHEIQNPLNFVNNFAEVNRELVAEMKEEIAKGNFDEVKIIASGIDDNSAKISEHGKRADSIVKSMLQHSRVNNGQKELTDINDMADEYLRLSYHGLRAKDKSFNAALETHFEPSLPRVNVIPQDIGRVLLNLYNNAFYAVNAKRKTEGESYQPKVTVSTGISPDSKMVTIIVADNGNGMPGRVKDKIFQPFYTTKPAGEGTGLGLSLSYDIITKGHGGMIKAESIEGEGSEFVVSVPLNH